MPKNDPDSNEHRTIGENKVCNFDGDTVLKDIGDHATVIVKNGSLLVTGNIGSRARITVNNDSSGPSITTYTTIMGGLNQITTRVVTTQPSTNCFIVSGNIGSETQINCDGDIGFSGYLFQQVTAETRNGKIIAKDLGIGVRLITRNGKIKAGNLEEGAYLETRNGNIEAGNVAKNGRLETRNGKIEAGDLEEGVHVETRNGKIKAGHVSAQTTVITGSSDIHIESCDPSALVKTERGSCYINGVKDEKRSTNQPSNDYSSMSGVTFVGVDMSTHYYNDREVHRPRWR